jgi:alpha-D-ribose 1-methylphosphonate 5-triphosphate diphosphatase PhnM
MASTNPAAMMSLTGLGTIAYNQRADLVLFTMESGEMVVQKTYVAGQLVYSRK